MKRRRNDQHQQYWGDWLSRSIANSGKTQSELARFAGVSDPQVTRWKAGQAPSDEASQKIADFFKVDRLRLAVTAGRISEEMAGVKRLPLPDDSAQRSAERKTVGEFVAKRVSKDRDREVLLTALEALNARDTIDGATDEEVMAEALKRTEDAVVALGKLLKPSRESDT
ncbi:helix-turn-helix domain-containing protein [Streptomyces sp. S1]|uniref:helix-turn-helix domain-containing protein n=1 Tax=Streptomyces sp. S1 TaxID=718288 RepID=UPI003D710E4A